MSMFGGGGGGRGQSTPATGFSVVDAQLVIRGDLDTTGTVRVDGQVLGGYHRAGTLIVGVGGLVAGDVEARDVVVAGAVHGNVMARGRVEVERGALVQGEVRASTMTLHEGGAVNGRLSVGGDPLPPTVGRDADVAPATLPVSRSRG